MFSRKNLGNYVRIRNSSHTSETIVLCLAGIDLATVVVDCGFRPLQPIAALKLSSDHYTMIKRVREEINSIHFLSTTSAEATVTNGGTFPANFSSLQVLDEVRLELSNIIIVVFDELRQLSDPTTDVNAGSRIRNAHGIKDLLDALVSLVAFVDV